MGFVFESFKCEKKNREKALIPTQETPGYWVPQTSLVVRAQPLSTLPLPNLAIILLPTTKEEICFPKIFKTNGGPQSLTFANL